MTESGPHVESPAGDRDLEPKVSTIQHLVRLGLLMIAAALLLGWLATRTDILFADGLRYIAQARDYARGPGGSDFKKSVDHPVYPLAVAAAHYCNPDDRPQGWQAAAQLVSVCAGVLLIIPLYLVSRELFGDATAIPACLLFYLVPLTGHVFADTLSESTFLLFWTTGLYSALRFMRTGSIRRIPAVVSCSALAYLTRPEGLLLPAAVVASLALCPLWVARRLGKRGLLALGVLMAGSACLVGPYVALKGGLGTKPSIARLLGVAPKSDAHAVERQRPLEPGQTEALTYLLAGKAVLKAVTEAVTWPLMPLSVLGFVILGLTGRDGASRQLRLLGVIGLASLLALVRLHATGGYCTPRHAMILSTIAIPAAGFGLNRLITKMASVFGSPRPARALGWSAALVAVCVLNGSETLAPVNPGLDGYRQAGEWLAGHAPEGSRVVDVTGWSQFYGRREGFTFENLVAAAGDPSARWVVVREAHLKGPWEYCLRLRALVDGLEPVETFRGSARRRPTKVYVFDRQQVIARQNAPGTVRK